MLNCRPNGRRRLGRPLKRLLVVAETRLLRSNWWRMMIMLTYTYEYIYCGNPTTKYEISKATSVCIIVHKTLYLSRAVASCVQQCTVPVCRHVPLCGGVNMPEDQKPHHQRSGELVSHP